MRFPEIAVYNRGDLVGEIAGYTDLNFSFKWKGIDSAEITVPGVPSFLSGIADLKASWLDIVINDVVPWTGHVTDVSIKVSKSGGFVTEFDCEGAKAVLNGLLLYPDPSSELGNQSAAEEFKMTGLADDVVGTVVYQAASRQGVPVSFIPGGSESAGSAIINVSGRMETLGKALEEAVTAVGLGLRARFWYPGLGLPDVVQQPGAVIVDVVEPTENPVVMWGQEDIVDGGVQFSSASSANVVVGGDGQGIERQYAAITDPSTSSVMWPWGGLQTYVDAPPAQGEEFNPSEDAKVVDAANSAKGKLAAEVTVQDGSPFIFGKDYLLGDVVKSEVAGISVRAQIAEVQVSVSASGGRKVTPKIGEKQTSPISELVGVVADLARDKDIRERQK